MKPVKLIIGLPIHNTAEGAFIISLAGLCSQLGAKGIPHEVMFVQVSSVVLARNAIAAAFLASAGSHLLFVDADMEFRPELVFDLLKANHPLSGSPYSKKEHPPECTAISLPGSVPDAAGFQEVAGLGCGVMLIQRQVIERVAAASPVTAAGHPAVFSFPDGESGEDWSFCAKWRALGGKVMAYGRHLPGHVGHHTYRLVYPPGQEVGAAANGRRPRAEAVTA